MIITTFILVISMGNRKDLHILRIEKSTVETNPNIDTRISF
jgi:hypothetical protein